MAQREDHGDEFYPYRVQEEAHGKVDVPEYTALHNHMNDGHHVHHHTQDHNFDLVDRSRKQLYPKWLQIAAVGFGIFCFLGIAAIWMFNDYTRQQIAQQVDVTVSPTPTVTPSPTPSPTPTLFQPQFPDGELQAAYSKTTTVSSAKVAFVAQVETSINQNTRSDAPEQFTLRSNAQGYLVGSAVDDTMQTELRIAYADDDSRNASFQQILVGEDLFIKKSSSGELWKRRQRSDYNRLYENQPIDATAYAYNMLDTLFSEGKAFLRAIDAGSIQREGDRDIDGKKFVPYKFRLDIPRYIETLERDPNANAFIIEDARKILSEAQVTGTLFINKDTGYIERIEFIGDNFTQISDEEAVQLGITAKHRMQVLALFTDYNAPLTIVPPPENEVE